MTKYFYVAAVDWDPEEDGHIITTHSLHCTDNIIATMAEVVADFGEDTILSVKITPCNDGTGNGILISDSLAHAFMTTDPIAIKCVEEE